MIRFISKLLKDTGGVSAIEYCLLAALIALGIATSAGQLGTQVSEGLADAEAPLEAVSGGEGGDDAKGKGEGKGKGKGQGKGKGKK